jgi:D-alanyl-D-alanine dipeptidase
MERMPKLSPAEPVSELRRVKIRDNGEPLVDFRVHCPRLLVDRPRFNYRRETLLRLGAAERLGIATTLMPPGYRIAIVEGWRAPHIQKRMYMSTWNRIKERHPLWTDVQLRRVVNRFTAPIGTRVPPPHSTGGAMDVFLVDDLGKPFDLRTPYEIYDPAGFSLDAPGLSDTARKHRQILANAMIEAGITNYPSEFWHFSYGDQGWAYRGGHPEAIYGATEPVDWSPEPGDLLDEPLVFVARDD